MRLVTGLGSSLQKHCETLDLFIELYMTEKNYKTLSSLNRVVYTTETAILISIHPAVDNLWKVQGP